MEQMDDRQRLAQLEARARMMEAELAGLNATIATLRARLSTRYEPAAAPAAFAPVGIPSVPPPPQDFRSSTPQPPPAAVTPSQPAAWQPAQAASIDEEIPAQTEAAAPEADGVYLPPLPPYDNLRQKWDIGTGETSVTPPPSPVYAEAPVMAPVQYAAADPELRLFGLLTDGSPWEYRIPFSCMAAEGGICIGRDATYSHVILNDGSVSRCHMRLELTEQGIVVSDLNTTNGSVINDHVIEEYENRLPLNDGDTLTLGNVTLQAQFLQ